MAEDFSDFDEAPIKGDGAGEDFSDFDKAASAPDKVAPYGLSGLVKGEHAAPGEERGPVEAFLRKASSAVSSNLVNPISAKISSVISGQPYDEALKGINESDASAAADNPTASTAGNVVGTGLQIAAPLGKVAQGAGVLGKAATAAKVGAGFGAAQGVGDALTAGGGVAEAVEGGVKGGLVGGTVGGTLGAGVAKVGQIIGNAGNRIAKRAVEDLGVGVGKPARRGLEAEADGIWDAVSSRPEMVKAAEAFAKKNDAKPLMAEATKLAQEGNETAQKIYTEAAQPGYAKEELARLGEESAALRQQARAVRDQLPDVRDKVSRVSDKMIVGAEGRGPLDQLAAKVERKRLKYESIVNKEDRARAKESWQVAKDELAAAKKSANANEIAEVRGVEPSDAVPTHVEGEPTAAITSEPMSKMVGAGTGAGEDVAAGQARRAALPDDYSALDKTQRIEYQTPNHPSAAYAAKLEAKAAALDNHAALLSKGGVPVAPVGAGFDARIAELENGTSADRATAKALAKIRDEFASSRGKVSSVHPAKLRAEQSAYQKKGKFGNATLDEQPTVAANREASKIVGDALLKHVTGMDYETAVAHAEANPDSVAAKLLEANGKIAAASKIEDAIKAKAGSAPPERGWQAAAHLAKHAAAGSLAGAAGMHGHGTLAAIIAAADLAHTATPHVARAVDPLLKGLSSKVASVAPAALRPAVGSGFNRAVAQLWIGATRNENPAMLLQQAKADGIDETTAANIIAKASPRMAEASP